MKTHFKLFGGALALIFLTVSGTSYLLKPAGADSLPLSTRAPQTGTVSDSPPVNASLIPLVSVADVFGTKDRDVKFMVPKDGSNHSILATSFYSNGTNLLTLPSNFEGTGVDLSPITSDQTVAIVQYITFTQDATIVWAEGETKPNHTWAPHPVNLTVKAGQSASVAYTSTDHGKTWIGSVKIVSGDS